MELIRLVIVALCFASTLGQLPSQDILALLEFKKGIKHDPTGYVLNSWNEESIDFNGCPSSWNGIMCNGGNVAAIILDSLGLSGEAELSVLSNLSMLVKLSISNNSMTGKLPNNIGELKSLQYLDVSNNMFFSTLPPDIGKLESLRNLSLSGNNFSGPIPDTIAGLASIQSLDLSHNSFSGHLPYALTKLTGLVYLNLSLNEFTKKIPKGFEMMPRLEVLDLHGNVLHGDLDPEFLLLTAATHVDFSGNLLTNAPSQNQNFLPRLSENLQYLNLSQNQLRGSLGAGADPQAFGSLKVLDLSYNQLSGELPGFDFVYDLQVLKLSNNQFSGFVPGDLLKGDSLVLTELDLSSNNLTGPVGMITSTTLRILNLSSNALSGELPLLTGSCTVIDLSKNDFEGNLNRMLKWGDIEVLDLSQNHLTGPIPEITAQFLRLNYLNFSHNALNGSLPRVVTQFPKLAVLDLSFNQLDGPLPSAFFTMSTLQELYLQHNIFDGSIDFSPSLSNETNLRVLDLSHNQLTGFFPDGFGSFTALQVLNIAGNNFSGSVPTSVGNISSLNSMDISQNNFTGPLPQNLPDSLQGFNASYNDLSGVVPENLRKFPRSSFYPGNSKLLFPNSPTGSGHTPSGNSHQKSTKTIIKVVVIIACVVAVVILIMLAILIQYHCMSRRRPLHVTNKDIVHRTPQNSSSSRRRDSAGSLVVSTKDLMTSRKGSSSEIISPDEKFVASTGFSPSKTSHLSWSPESGDSYSSGHLARLDVRSPDRLAGQLYFLDDTISFTPEELSRAPAEVLGRSSHGTSYRATFNNGLLLTVKWLREGVAKQRKDFAKEAKKFASIRHPNVVGLRGYYWGPTQHEKLIISDYISPGSLATFLYGRGYGLRTAYSPQTPRGGIYWVVVVVFAFLILTFFWTCLCPFGWKDRPRRKGPPLTWTQRLKIAVDVARGLNYLHFDRAVPHGNLKATNILLDGPDLNARVADYCLHRLMNQAGTTEQILDAGVLGYRAPELASAKKPLPSFKSDVYAFGVILLELLTGKCAGDVVLGEDGYLTDWVRLRVAEGRGAECFDAALQPDVANPAAEKAMKEVLGMALRCIRSVSERPGIKAIYEDLSSI